MVDPHANRTTLEQETAPATMNDYSLRWDNGVLVAVDQRELPHRVRLLRITTVAQLIDAVRTLAIRGAPAIGIAGAFGVALAARAHTNADGIDIERVTLDATRIATARPTAVNLTWGVHRALAKLPVGYEAVVGEALTMVAEDARVNLAAANHAADLLVQVCPDRPLRVLTHCNTGSLATCAIGTALGAIRVLASRGKIHSVLVGETRPLLQGARLTTWELAEANIPHRLAVDSAAAWAIASGEVDCVVVGADRIAANGDVVNKVGTYALALAAQRHQIPFVVVAPESTRDPGVDSGRDIVVEERPANEVTGFAGIMTAPRGTAAFNPAFDVTPANLITAVVTERGTPSGEWAPGLEFSSREKHLAAMAKTLYERGWMPGTAGNISVRTGRAAGQVLITGSGRSKGELTERDVVCVRVSDSRPVAENGIPPSAETAIHTALYRATGCAAVVHVHSPHAAAVSARYGRPEGMAIVAFKDYELIKGLADQGSTEVPVFPNWALVARIGLDVELYLKRHPGAPPVLLIAAHGATAWGDSLAQARDRVECLEALCQLVTSTGRPYVWPPADERGTTTEETPAR